MANHTNHLRFQTYTKDQWAVILYEALNSPLGLWVRTKPERLAELRTALYTARKQLGDPALDALTLRTPPPPYDIHTELWIVNMGGLPQ